MPYQDVRDYIEELTRRDLLQVIDETVSKDTELVPLVRLQFRGLAEERRKAFWLPSTPMRTTSMPLTTCASVSARPGAAGLKKRMC